MKTIEDIYAEMFEAHENIMAARRQEHIRAANPYGCNQYGEGWKQPHNGKQTWRPGNKAKKDSGEEKKKNEPEQEKKKEQQKAKADTEKKVDEAENKANEAKKESSVAKQIQELDWRLYKVEEEITRNLNERTIAVKTKDDDKLQAVMRRLQNLALQREFLENEIKKLKSELNDDKLSR